MSSFSVYLPEHVKQGLDRAAERSGKSRNRLIVEACEALVRGSGGAWPQGFFDERRLSARDRSELRKGAEEIDRIVRTSRRNRKSAPF